MAAVSVLGLGQLSASGAGMAALAEAMRGDPPGAEWVPTTTAAPFVEAPVLRAKTEGTEGLLPPRALRRIDSFAKNFVLASRLAVEDGGVELPPPERIGVVMGTAYGSLVTAFSNLDDLIEHGDAMCSPFKFSISVNNAPSSCVSTLLGARGPCMAVTGFRYLVANVLRVATHWLEAGAADLVIVGAGDEYHAVMGYGLEGGEGWPADGRVRPLDFDSPSFVPGETFAALLLGRDDGARRGEVVIESVETHNDLAGEFKPAVEMPIHLAADGRGEVAAVYGAIAGLGNPVVANAAYWGGSPSAEAMTLLAACAGLRSGEIDAAGVDCVLANPDGSGTVVEVAHGNRDR
jgi:3-oxoacyl-[acyl-carrier-protein] synthase II